MAQLRHEASHEADSDSALAEIEDDAGDYRAIAERRVRLGLLLSEIGHANGIEVSQAEMNRLIGQAASQYQPKDRERFIKYVRSEPMAAAQLRAPLYEDKVVDFLFSKAEITERAVSRAEVEAELESEEGHVHGPDCGHDHEPAKPAKPLKTAAKSKPPREAKTAKIAEPETGAAETAADTMDAAPVPAEPVKKAATRAAPAAKAAAKPKKAK